mmetsp:Transcript_32549/g.81982  ORF Transcript_32549/g.81982 Transcript_32549/m.81982 type:complete len:216 (-) Transcript_32549:842-1489(-)
MPLAGTSMTRIRISRDSNRHRSRHTSESGSPSAAATAAAAAAFMARCAPGSEIVTVSLLDGTSVTSALPRAVSVSENVTSRNPVERTPLRTMSGCASSLLSCRTVPNVRTSQPGGTGREETHVSSAFTTQMSPCTAVAKSSPFARATPWRLPPTPSRWTGATLMTTRTVGRAISASRAISPKPLIPSSSTHTSVVAGIRSKVSGTPTWLFRLPRV